MSKVPAEHWDEIFRNRDPVSFSWHEPAPSRSLALIESIAGDDRPAVIDIGAGSANLVDELMDRGFPVAVLDVSEAAVERTKQRLGPRAVEVRWIVANVAEVEEVGEYGIWHDRAAFHFLIDAGEQQRYIDLCAQSVVAGGHAVVQTFAEDGPERCSGLPVARYDAAALATRFAPNFALVGSERFVHTTPRGVEQRFTSVVLRREAG